MSWRALPAARVARRCGLLCVVVWALPACDRDRVPDPAEARAGDLAPVITTGLQPGPTVRAAHTTNPYADDPGSVAEGRRLYAWMNCHGCHGMEGGGGIGPPFADADWIYGSAPDQLFQSIAQGRPNGMPAFGLLLPPDRIWMIVAYVQSIGGGAAAATGERPVTESNEGAAQESGSGGGS